MVLFIATLLATVSAHADNAPDKSAVVIIEMRFSDGASKPSVGTGFLVDNDGLIVTADHVVRGYVPKSGGELNSLTYNPGPQKQILSADLYFYGSERPVHMGPQQFVSNLRLGAPQSGGVGADVAAFRAPVPDSVRQGIRPLDISFDVPVEANNYWVAGPLCKRSTPDCYKPQMVGSAQISAETVGARQYLVHATITASFSGGPLINSAGLVVGLTSWGESDFDDNVQQAWFTPAKAIRNLLPDANHLPSPSAQFRNSILCTFLDSFDKVPFFTAMEMVHVLASQSRIEKAQCDCCCRVVGKMRHDSLELPELAALTCQDADQCEEMRIAKSANALSTNPQSGALEKTLHAYVNIHETLAVDDSAVAKADAYDRALAALLARLATSQQADATFHLATEAVLVNLRDISAERPSVDSFESMEQLFYNEGSNAGAEAAKSLSAMTKSGKDGTQEFGEALKAVDRAIRELITKNSVIRLEETADSADFAVTSIVTVPPAGAHPNINCDDQFYKYRNQIEGQLKLIGLPLGAYVGPLTTITGTYLSPELQATSAAHLEQHGAADSGYANCALIGVVVPKNASIKELEYFAAERNGSAKACTAKGNQNACLVGFSSYLPSPDVLQTAQYQVILATFANGSETKARQASFTVKFSVRQ